MADKSMKKRWISLYVENQVGVLSKISGLFLTLPPSDDFNTFEFFFISFTTASFFVPVCTNLVLWPFLLQSITFL